MKSFEKIIGYENVKKELYQIIDMFKNFELYEKIGASLPHGIIIEGEPGLGKTMVANAVIEECGVKSYVLVKNKGASETLKEISSTFEDAIKNEPSIILIDDIDKFSDTKEIQFDDEVFAAIQSAINLIKDHKVLVIATANNLDKLPESLIRSERFDRRITLKTPEGEDAQKIIEYYMKSKCSAPNLNFEDISKMISYSSCATLKTIINESAILAAYKRKKYIEIDDIVEVVLRNEYGTPQGQLLMDEKYLENVCMHEAGHAVISSILHEDSVGMVSVANLSEYHEQGFTRLCIEHKRRPEAILAILGGKAACELFAEGKCASGCYSDLQKASKFLKIGMNRNATHGFGLLDVGETNKSDYFNNKTETVIQTELERYMFMARDVLIKNKDFVFKVAKELKEKRTLLYSDIKRIRDSVTISNIVLP